ncbi:hypothetical protein Poli38472_007061 [Pythium oligandrum]|uniref:Uncharacterized protein n=1 Tax=Pythium oligandrum TaxID=41045 RepID=A0A8K1C9L6_PYTOL|nr:hypothetical protein Poli38472_007061 [Pythium oligandrum]|eukprot:TMW58916.1 hypothetical protein Poli38472_007061 [Pythium oligandrum]
MLMRPSSKSVAANGSATIAQITSGLGSIKMNTGEYLNPGYRTSKAALNMLNMVVAHEVKAHKIATVVLCPGFVATDLNGHTGILQPSQSAAMLAKNIAGVKLEETGKFISHDGNEYPW